MNFTLKIDNVIDYLISQQICETEAVYDSFVEPKIFKNFNLLVHLADGRQYLVKQAANSRQKQSNSELAHEWRLHQLLQAQPELSKLRLLVSEVIHADLERNILVFNYLSNYSDLETFYTGYTSVSDRTALPTAVAAELGVALATTHRATFRRDNYRRALDGPGDVCIENTDADHVPDFGHGLDDITPEIFGEISIDGLKFYQLYQRHEELKQAIADLSDAFEPCCLTHNDLKLNNILLHHQWQALLGQNYAGQNHGRQNRGEQNHEAQAAPIRLIDWEKWSWGDPSSDLGMLLAEYLKLWLKSLVISPSLDLQTSLQSAAMPLETLQPSMVALLQAYLQAFPELLNARPQLLSLIMQFTGLALIEAIQARLYYLEPFGNIEICMLQVAKTLLCTPEQSFPSLLGQPLSQFIPVVVSA